MHELSVARSLMDIVEDHARRNGARRVTRIVVVVGVLSGVEPELLRRAFEVIREGTVAGSATLVIEMENLGIRCGNCGAFEEKEELSVLCSRCGSSNTEVVRGEDLLLRSLEMELDEASQNLS